MIPEIGHFALILALVLAVLQGTLPLLGAARGNAALMAVGKPAAQAQFLFTLLAFAALMWAYVTSDFSVANVAANSHTQKPLLYKISGVWGNHEGSMVLWVLILALFGAMVAAADRQLPATLRARVLAVQGLIGVAFLTFILFSSNPFERIFPAPGEGQGLNPLLQDPGLAFHPPFLYLGYVGFSIAFSFAIAALIEGRVDAAWARWVRPWTLAAWAFLTLGIALGSWWAYYELGWGGWWFWDPVENASFMPWLAGTALLHSAIVVEKRDALKSWTILLAIIAFSLSLLGTFLVRSGVLTSVHAFASDPDRGIFILAILIATVGASLTLYAVRAPGLKGGGLFRPISREGGMVLNNLLMTVAAATVLLGTLYPLLMDAFDAGRISVGPPYYEATFVPLMIPMLVALGAAPLLAWKRADLMGVLGRLKFAFGATLLVVLGVLFLHDRATVGAVLGIGLSAWLAGGAFTELAERLKLFRQPVGATLRRAWGLPRAAYGMTLAHLGVAVAVAGMTASAAWQQERILVMQPGDSAEIAGYTITFEGVSRRAGPNYVARQGALTVRSGGVVTATLRPEVRAYPAERQRTTEAAIRTTLFADLYAVLGEPEEAGAGHTIRLYHNPLVPWIWGGAILMFLGGAVSLTDRRHRVGAPKRKGKPAAKSPKAPGEAPA